MTLLSDWEEIKLLNFLCLLTPTLLSGQVPAVLTVLYTLEAGTWVVHGCTGYSIEISFTPISALQEVGRKKTSYFCSQSLCLTFSAAGKITLILMCRRVNSILSLEMSSTSLLCEVGQDNRAKDRLPKEIDCFFGPLSPLREERLERKGFLEKKLLFFTSRARK